ncbi:MAG TPA: short-chain dehydrogenase/reductase [Burkholderiales bacterium]|jgi:NAD(P)-dependent dehydrogenase (short-subunit alcohol dehydrogenase family)|nr:short-chain dehydrogenase/reductase [Burkholderiales bacterium]
MDLGLRGRTALVTGGSRGLGLGTAQVLAAEGCHLHLASRNAADLDAARTKIMDVHDVEVTCHAMDLGSSENVKKLAKACFDVDILVNNAGAIPQGTVTGLDEKSWREAWDLKVFGFINLIREIYPVMCERRRGVIVNVIGTAGERPAASYIAGSMGNASLIALTRALGAESPASNVRVVGVNPGATETDRQVVRWRARAEKELGSAEHWRELTAGFPFGRLGTVNEVTNMIAFLCSDLSSYTTGTVVTIDGGASWKK